MKCFDFEYYKTEYRGELDEESFERFSPCACDVVSLLVGFDCSDVGDENVLRALCLECDCLSRQSHGGALRRENIGDMSAEYSVSDTPTVFGCDISGDVIAALTRSGHLTRWA